MAVTVVSYVRGLDLSFGARRFGGRDDALSDGESSTYVQVNGNFITQELNFGFDRPITGTVPAPNPTGNYGRVEAMSFAITCASYSNVHTGFHPCDYYVLLRDANDIEVAMIGIETDVERFSPDTAISYAGTALNTEDDLLSEYFDGTGISFGGFWGDDASWALTQPLAVDIGPNIMFPGDSEGFWITDLSFTWVFSAVSVAPLRQRQRRW
jgi:hypothetical protein